MRVKKRQGALPGISGGFGVVGGTRFIEKGVAYIRIDFDVAGHLMRFEPLFQLAGSAGGEILFRVTTDNRTGSSQGVERTRVCP